MAPTLPRLLDFAVVGAAKSGTSSLCSLMDAHSRVHVLEPKDGHYALSVLGRGEYTGPGDHVLNENIRVSGRAYAEQLQEADSRTRVGDASVFYMTDRRLLEALSEELRADAPVIAVLRRPDARAYSAYMHRVREGLEEGTFEEGLAKEQQRVDAGWEPIWWYRRLGRYAQQVADLFEVFGRDRVHVVLLEDLSSDPRGALQDVYDALGLEWEDVELHQDNASGVPRSRALQAFLYEQNAIKTLGSKIIPRPLWHRVRRWIQRRNLQRVPVTAEDRTDLVEYYRADIERLQELLGRDLSAWTR